MKRKNEKIALVYVKARAFIWKRDVKIRALQFQENKGYVKFNHFHSYSSSIYNT